MKLTGPQFKQLRDALVSAFPTYAALAQMVRIGLEENLAAIAGQGGLAAVVSELITHAEAQGRITELIAAAREENPANTELRQFAEGFAIDPAAPGEPERIVIDNVKFTNINEWIERLIERKRTVCKIEVPRKNGKVECGTGFLLGPGVVMTNYHVVQPLLTGESEPASMVLRFDYEVSPRGKLLDGKTYALAADWQIDSSEQKELDHALLRVAGDPGKRSAAKGAPPRGWLTPELHEFEIGEPINILQHPEAKPLAVAQGSLLKVDKARKRIFYSANTEFGSSGSPCFDGAFNLVALHRGRDPKGNEGVPFADILDRLREKMEFPTKSGHGVNGYSDCSYSAGDTYPSDACRRLLL